MKQDWEEKKIRQLFRDERRADESYAPRFAATLEAVQSRRREYRRGRLSLQIAFAIVALLAAIGVVRLLTAQTRNEQPAIVAEEPHQPASAAPPIVAVVPSPKEPDRVRRVGRRHRQTTPPAAPLISQWRSPTGFLLTTPGDQLLKTVPKIGTSAIEIKLNFPDQKN